MQTSIVKDIMVPLAEYAVIGEDASLYEAIIELKRAQENFSRKNSLHAHRAILVRNKSGRIIGKISQMDALKALEPKARNLISKTARRIGFSKNYLVSTHEQFRLWDIQIEHISNQARHILAKDAMYALTSGEYIDSEATLAAATHQLARGNHHSLLVTDKKKNVVGILRQVDVFTVVFSNIGPIQ
ncbi:hypothetical protein A2303_03905 [Candidatus Falkowbacteria bacterium RIFOXYB2_FULL_47_14]|uniref:CBS domain-containing protein n=1 Tax=Candidatus Falkowbacteria bacterium RIFOXYA2_FULL_47_19 TaxID=1797994 RepID=A0A1F5SHZ9_9BACT|nr:MAG: hypothetical protein A2227_03450 [Candidatus Falkowbacteria bacterium RIFOXYA2_FULL_47_19]OGF37291.1 MAG: hypothetical protein A2468_01490 [Candidatus Falkowbacteria bacterium RIFOXYC2_FULL_46_15]OGF42541.1 MAG: hypothetical protein A2303_03905 [Candidatus Falkowbacteria bacterium RIFOXYB2_FULL_47_14]